MDAFIVVVALHAFLVPRVLLRRVFPLYDFFLSIALPAAKYLVHFFIDSVHIEHYFSPWHIEFLFFLHLVVVHLSRMLVILEFLAKQLLVLWSSIHM